MINPKLIFSPEAVERYTQLVERFGADSEEIQSLRLRFEGRARHRRKPDQYTAIFADYSFGDRTDFYFLEISTIENDTLQGCIVNDKQYWKDGLNGGIIHHFGQYSTHT